MSLIGNIIWFIFGGLEMGLAWVVAIGLWGGKEDETGPTFLFFKDALVEEKF